MKKILKYEFKRRYNTIVVLAGSLLALSVFCIVLSAVGVIGKDVLQPFFYLALFVIYGIPVVMFFMCCAGHPKDLLYNDTNYLILTIPVKGRVILGGRLMVGFLEVLFYSLITMLFALFSTPLFLSSMVTSAGYTYHLREVMNTLKELFTDHLLEVCIVFASLVVFFFFVGTLILLSSIITRYFFKKKRLAHFISVVLFFVLFFSILNVGSQIQVPIGALNKSDGFDLAMKLFFLENIVSSGFMALVSVGAFFVSSWLLDHKVEV